VSSIFGIDVAGQRDRLQGDWLEADAIARYRRVRPLIATVGEAARRAESRRRLELWLERNGGTVA
jgi:hypothetical protein